MFSYHRAKGVALITVLLIVALAAVLATQMTARLQLQMQRTININFNQQAYWYALGAEAFTKRVLIESFKSEKNVTNLGQMWAQGETSFPVDFGEITGEISDMQACFNLNALQDTSKQGSKESYHAEAAASLKRLIESLEVEGISNFEAQNMADALVDWLDEDTAITNVGGAEDNDYSAKEFPYLSANNLLASVNEMRVIEHFTLPVINALKDYVCVIPDSNLFQINVNTLDSEQAKLLAAILDISESDASQIISTREESGWEKIEDFFSLPEMSTVQLDDSQKQHFVVDSEYFKLKASTKFNDSYFSLNSIMHIEDNKKVTVISRSVGRF